MGEQQRDVSQQESGSNKATAGVIARPPFLFLGALILGFALNAWRDWPIAGPDYRPGLLTIGVALIIAGAAFVAAGVLNFRQAQTPVPTNEPTRALVTSGIHGRSRNPIYVGLFAIYFGIALTANSAWVALLVLPLAAIMRYGVVAREEVYLERLFGQDYRDYKARVRRWL